MTTSTTSTTDTLDHQTASTIDTTSATPRTSLGQIANALEQCLPAQVDPHDTHPVVVPHKVVVEAGEMLRASEEASIITLTALTDAMADMDEKQQTIDMLTRVVTVTCTLALCAVGFAIGAFLA